MAAWLYTSAEDDALDGVQVLELDHLVIDAEREMFQHGGAVLLHEVVPRLAQRYSGLAQLAISEVEGGRPEAAGGTVNE